MVLNVSQPIDANSRTITSASVLVTLIDDTTDSSYVYIGKAIPGKADTTGKAESVWQISRVENSTGSTAFAEGSEFFDKVWNDRTSYTYS